MYRFILQTVLVFNTVTRLYLVDNCLTFALFGSLCGETLNVCQINERVGIPRITVSYCYFLYGIGHNCEQFRQVSFRII